ncbi:hypothetical protein Ciccas_010080 [Cichlidogyrus casuarinus]|uniref:Uncharacterized protein n=1 Tax=Cichlidogyrus casuarinus TaxID=1844966 RepID=A0ABD2PV54_9PLAT
MSSNVITNHDRYEEMRMVIWIERQSGFSLSWESWSGSSHFLTLTCSLKLNDLSLDFLIAIFAMETYSSIYVKESAIDCSSNDSLTCHCDLQNDSERTKKIAF